MGERGHVEGKGAVAGQVRRRLPHASVSSTVGPHAVPEHVVLVHAPRGVGTVPQTVHGSHIRDHARAAARRRVALEVNAGLMDGVAGGVVHREPQQQPGFGQQPLSQNPGGRGVVGRCGVTGRDVRIGDHAMGGYHPRHRGFVLKFGPAIHRVREGEVGK